MDLCRVDAGINDRNRFSPVLAISLLLVSASLTGCSYVPGWANPVSWYEGATGDSAPRPEKIARAEEKPAPGRDQAFPNLSSVPGRPAVSSASENQKTAAGLAADRDQAKYTDEQLRADTAVQAPASVAPQGAVPTTIATASPVKAPAQAVPPAPPAAAPGGVLAPAAQPSQPVPLASLEGSPTPMIAAMTQRHRQGQSTEVPSVGTLGQRVTVPGQSGAESLAPTQLPAYPVLQSPAPQSSDVLGATFRDRLQASGATVTTAPASGGFAGSGQATESGSGPASAAPQQGTSETRIASLAPLLPASEMAGVLHFAHGSTKLESAEAGVIQAVAKEYKRRGGTVRVVGHSSSRTKDLDVQEHKVANFTMSLKRAESVARALARRGVPSSQIIIEARGDSDPLYFEAMPRGEAENRRVEIFLEN